jgi:hypothetical protein
MYKIFINTFIVASLLILSAYLYLSLFAQPSADDFAFALKSNEMGFIGSQIDWYLSWTGRYGSTAMLSIVSWFNILNIYRAIPIILILTSFFSILIFVKHHSIDLKIMNAVLYSLVILILYLTNLGSLGQTIYWLAGSITYQMSIILYIQLLYLYTLIYSDTNRNHNAVLYSITFILLIIAAGCNETILVLLIMTYVLLTLFVLNSNKRNNMSLIIYSTLCLVITGICAFVVIKAPGNQIRMACFKGNKDILNSLTQSYVFGIKYLINKMQSLNIWAATCLLLPGTSITLQKLKNNTNKKYIILLIPVFWLAMLFFLFLPSFYSMNEPPPLRTYSVIDVLFYLGWFPTVAIIWYFIDRKLIFIDNKLSIFIASTLFIIWSVTSINTKNVYTDIINGKSFYNQVEDRYSFINDAKLNNKYNLGFAPITYKPKVLHFEDITTDIHDWHNDLYCKFFKLLSVKLVLY